MTGSNDRPERNPPAAGKSRPYLLAAISLLLLVAVSAGAVVAFWNPLRYGRVEPPAVVPVGLAPPVADKIRQVKAVVRANPYSAEAWGRLGGTFHVHDMLAEAVVCYERAHRLDPSEFRWPYFLGRCKVVGDQQAALEWFMRASELRADYAPLQERLGRGLFFIEDFEQAGARYQRAVELDPTFIRAYLGLGQVALAKGDARQAIEHLQKAIDQGAVAGEVHWLMSEAYRRLGDLGAAEHHAQLGAGGQLMELRPDPVYTALALDVGATLRWYRARADAYLRQGRVEEALAEWEQAARIYPESAHARAEIGRIHAQVGRIDQAIDAYERAIDLQPDDVRARYEYGVLLAMTGRLPDAAAAFRQVIEAQPNRVSAYISLARVLDMMDRPAEAIEVVRVGLVELPDDRQLAATLAWRLATCPESSVRDGEHALKLVEPLCADTDYQDALLLDTVAAASAEVGDFDAAVRYAQMAHRILSADADASSISDKQRVHAIERRIALYRARRPYRETASR